MYVNKIILNNKNAYIIFYVKNIIIYNAFMKGDYTMSIEVIDIIKPKNNSSFPIADSNDVLGGYHQVATVAERDKISQARKKVGMLCYVKEEDTTYQLKEDAEGQIIWDEYTPNAIHLGTEPPEDTRRVWIDTADEDIEEQISQSTALEQIQNQMKLLNEKYQEAIYIINHKLDGGYFLDKYPALDEQPENPLNTYDDNPYAGSVEIIAIKRGLKRDLISPEFTLSEGEFAFCIDTEELYIGNRGGKRLLAKSGGSTGGGGGTGNVTGQYMVLEDENRVYYRLKVDESGRLQIIKNDGFTVSNPEPSNTGAFSALIINHVFGGGASGKNESPVSHSFVELYNNSNYEINLKGLSLQVAGVAANWQVVPLFGIVKPRSSFLVRFNEVTSIDRATPRLKINRFDISSDIVIPSIGYKVYLKIGIDPTTHTNPANTDGSNSKELGYIDLVGVGGSISGQVIDAFEKSYPKYADINTSARRIDFKDTQDNGKDFMKINWKEANVRDYGPKCTDDGKWDLHWDKIQLDPAAPMLITVGFGQDGDRSRTFTWQTPMTKFGFVKYRKLNGEDRKFKFVESTKKTVSHADIEATIHSVIIRNLEDGTYEYQVGCEGKWSDVYEFNIKVDDEEQTINILQISDQQSTTEFGYLAWKMASNYILEKEKFKYVINTGDISDTASRSFEWRYYYEYGKNLLSNFEQMTTCGNNDLVNKWYSDAFEWYSTCENTIMPSCHSWNKDYIHFVNLNSNVKVKNSYPSGKPQPNPIEPQLAFLEKDLSRAINQKRWKIVYMHQSPYSIIREDTDGLMPFHDIFAKYEIDLVLSGHHHMHSRSQGMGPRTDGENGEKIDNVLSFTDYYKSASGGTSLILPIEKRTYDKGGVVYWMCQATGSKIQGKTGIAQAPADTDEEGRKKFYRAYQIREPHPSYSMFNITKDQITATEYKINNILPMDAPPLEYIPKLEPMEREVIDNMIIKRHRNSVTDTELRTTIETAKAVERPAGTSDLVWNGFKEDLKNAEALIGEDYKVQAAVDYCNKELKDWMAKIKK